MELLGWRSQCLTAAAAASVANTSSSYIRKNFMQQTPPIPHPPQILDDAVVAGEELIDTYLRLVTSSSPLPFSVPPSEEVSAVYGGEGEGEGGMSYSLTRPRGVVRLAVQELLCHLSSIGDHNRCVDLITRVCSGLSSLPNNAIPPPPSPSQQRLAESLGGKAGALKDRLSVLAGPGRKGGVLTGVFREVEGSMTVRFTGMDNEWLREMFCRVLEASEGGGALLLSRQLVKVAEEVQLATGSSFQVSLLKGLRTGGRQATLPLSAVDWKEFLVSSWEVVDGLTEEDRGSSEVMTAIVVGLCSFREGGALVKAREIWGEMRVSGGGRSEVAMSALLDAAAVCGSDEEVGSLLQEAEEVFAGSYSLLLLRSRVVATARLCRGFQALHLLRQLRRLGGRGDRRMYRWVVMALYMEKPVEEHSWRVARDPESVCKFM